MQVRDQDNTATPVAKAPEVRKEVGCKDKWVNKMISLVRQPEMYSSRPLEESGLERKTEEIIL